MTDHKHNAEQRNTVDLFSQFDPGELERVKKIWDLSGRLERETPQISGQEVERALSSVDKRIARNRNQNGTGFSIKWLAAAAAVLFLFGATFLLVPKTEYAPRGETVTVHLPDGSTVELNSDSRIRYNRLFGVTNRSVHFNGEAFFSVKKNNMPFLIDANHAVIEVTGTAFNVRSWNNEPDQPTEVAVAEGSVHFYRQNRRDSAVIVMPGHMSRLTEAMGKPTPPETVAVDRVTGWRDRMLVFNDRPLLVIFNELERRFAVKIRLENSDIGKETLTVFYADPSGVESVLQDICRVKGLRFAKTANGYRVYR